MRQKADKYSRIKEKIQQQPKKKACCLIIVTIIYYQNDTGPAGCNAGGAIAQGIWRNESLFNV